MDASKFGLSLLESLTIGMYTEENVCYREYIQNSCDSINRAVSQGVISFEDACIDVVIEPDERYVSILDNGLGLGQKDFYQTMANIAASRKKQGEDMGFRGIGRLIGMAFCKTLKFSASFEGEDVTSTFTWDGEKLAQMLRDNYDGSLDDAIIELIDYSKEPADPSERFFKVEMIDVHESSLELLNETAVCEYLQFVLPVDYDINFDLSSEIHDYAKSLNYHMEEHKVFVNGRELTKAYYRDLLKNGVPYDRIESLQFQNFYGKDGELLAWMWYGLSSFEIQIPKENPIRGLALRSSNIQLGTNAVFRNNFNDPRSCFYFVGEVFAVSNGLRPNARRDYFNPSDTLNEFTHQIESYFNDELRKIFNKANDIKNYYRDINLVDKKKEEHQQNLSSGKYLGEKEKEQAENAVKEAEKKAEKAKEKLEKVSILDPMTPMGKVADNIKKRHGSTVAPTSTKNTPPEPENTDKKVEKQPPEKPKAVIIEDVPLPVASTFTPITTSLPPQVEGISPPAPLPLAPEVQVTPIIEETIPVVYFHETLTQLKNEEKEIVREVLEMISSTLKEKELNEIKEKIKKKWN